MGWQTELLEAASDLVITQEEVTSLMSGVFDAGIRGIIVIGVMSMLVKEFYGVLGPKKFAKQKEEVLGLVEEIW